MTLFGDMGFCKIQGAFLAGDLHKDLHELIYVPAEKYTVFICEITRMVQSTEIRLAMFFCARYRRLNETENIESNSRFV